METGIFVSRARSAFCQVRRSELEGVSRCQNRLISGVSEWIFSQLASGTIPNEVQNGASEEPFENIGE